MLLQKHTNFKHQQSFDVKVPNLDQIIHITLFCKGDHNDTHPFPYKIPIPQGPKIVERSNYLENWSPTCVFGHCLTM